jgi:hypothetical protein
MGGLRHPRQLITINAVIDHDVREDQMVLRANRRLDVVADNAGSSGLHRASIGIGERCLPFFLPRRTLLHRITAAATIAPPHHLLDT